MAASFLPINAMSVVTGSGKLAPVTAIPVVKVTDGSVPVGPGAAQRVVEVAANFPRAPVQPIPIVYATGTPPVTPTDPIPVFVTGTVAGGVPDATNTGFRNAPGYPGLLTPGPGTIASNTTYSFKEFTAGVAVGEVGNPVGASVNNVTFYGCRFARTGDLNVGIVGDNITFDYCSFEPLGASVPPVSNAAGYQYGIAANGGFYTTCGKLTVTHCDFWGFANAIDTRGSTQAKPHVFEHNWFHDPRNDNGGADHTDAIGALGTDDYSAYVVINHNTIEAVANTNAIGYQFSTPANHGGVGYNHFTITNNLISGWNNAINFGGVFPDSFNSTASYITFTGNTFSTKFLIPNGVNHQNWWLTTGSVWSNNRWKVPAGAAWGTPENDGMFWIPTNAATAGATDFPYVSATDYLAVYAPPAGSISDDFNRANGALGANWGTDRNALTIVSNQAKGTSAANCATWRVTGTFAANQYSEIVWQGGAANGAGPIVRHNGVNPGTYYVAYFDGTKMYLESVAAGAYTGINGAGTDFVPVNGDVLRLEVSGTTLTVRRNGVKLYTTTNAAIATGRPGFEIFGTTIAVNDWAGG
jgi:hypothetical protein